MYDLALAPLVPPPPLLAATSNFVSFARLEADTSAVCRGLTRSIYLKETAMQDVISI
jgi:hypothetical protein